MISLKFPTSSDSFWKISEIGAEIRNEYQKKKTAKISLPSDKKFFLMISEMNKQNRIKELISRLRFYISNS